MYNILLVDDHKPNLRLLELTFEEAKIGFQSATSVDEAERLLEDRTFDLVLSDIRMPGASGFDLLQWMQERQVGTPVLFITSELPEAEHRIHGLSLGAVDYVSRSLDPEELVLRVRKAIEHMRETQQLKASLEDSEKLASLGRIIAASNHEVKNLAHIVRMCAQRLSESPDSAAKNLPILLNASNMLANVTRSLHSLLRGESVGRQAIELTELVNEMIQMAKAIMKNIALEAPRIKEGPCWVLGSPVALRQVLLNLILNARDAIEEQGESAGLIQFQVKRVDGQLTLSIIDNGVGLREAGIRDDFPAFATTKGLRGGSGLGLWLSQRLLQGMGSKLSLHSRGPGLGVEARILLEATDARADPLDLSAYLSEL